MGGGGGVWGGVTTEEQAGWGGTTDSSGVLRLLRAPSPQLVTESMCVLNSGSENREKIHVCTRVYIRARTCIHARQP